MAASSETNFSFQPTYSLSVKTTDNEEVYPCPECGRVFKLLNAFLSHARWKHGTEKNPKVCDKCGKSFKNEYNLQRHQAGHCVSVKDDSHKTKKCSLCEYSACERQSVVSHYEHFHGIDIETRDESFATFEEFLAWKADFERKTKSFFVKIRSPRKRQRDGVEIIQYTCHRDGKYVPSGRALRQPKAQGSNKINALCPARMDVTRGGERVTVHCVLTHVGHDLDLSRLYFTKEEKAFIAERLAAKIPFQQIIDEIQESCRDEAGLERIHLVKKKDLWNVLYSLNANCNKDEHDYAIYEKKLVRQLRAAHRRSLRLPEFTATQVGRAWTLEGSDGRAEFVVTEEELECGCAARCRDCDRCVHAYSCTCGGARGGRCEHVHLVCQLQATLAGAGAWAGAEAVIVEPEIPTHIDDDPDDPDDPVPQEAAEESQDSAEAEAASEGGENADGDFERRKAEALQRVLRAHANIENEEQLQVFERQVAPLETVIELLSQAEVVLALPQFVLGEPGKKRILVQKVYNS